ncbi:MAG: 4Fe-4S binding protein [Campylobacterota bacterium]
MDWLMVEFDRFRCLRTDYYHNDCQICKEISPDAVEFVNKIRIDTTKLHPSVIGACPSQAFSHSEYDVTQGLLKFINSDAEVLSGDSSFELVALNVEDFVSLALRKERLVVQSDDTVVQERVIQANAILKEFGCDSVIVCQATNEANRREFFSKVFTKIKQSKELQLHNVYSYDSRVPISRQLLKNSIKLHIPNLDKTCVQSSHYNAKKIDFDACDNCSDCVQFCPTNALFYSRDEVEIYFMQSSCIGCGICNHICHSDAISDDVQIDLVALAFEKEKKLVAHNLVACQKCKTPFSQKEGESVCKVCKQFESNDMFALASELEG